MFLILFILKHFNGLANNQDRVCLPDQFFNLHDIVGIKVCRIDRILDFKIEVITFNLGFKGQVFLVLKLRKEGLLDNLPEGEGHWIVILICEHLAE